MYAVFLKSRGFKYIKNGISTPNLPVGLMKKLYSFLGLVRYSTNISISIRLLLTLLMGWDDVINGYQYDQGPSVITSHFLLLLQNNKENTVIVVDVR